MKRLFKFKYPKILGLFLAIVVAYVLFNDPKIADYISHLGNWGYIGVFIAGILFSFGFTAPFAVGFFLNLSPNNILLAGIIGGLGALTADVMIFKMIKFSFEDEFLKIKKTKTLKKITEFIRTKIGYKIEIYMLYVFAGIVIASPLPDEIGVIMLAGITKIKIMTLTIISFILNTIGITILIII